MGSKNEFGKTILAAVDLAGDWNNVVAHGLHFARGSGASLHLVHVQEKPPKGLRRSLEAADLRSHRACLRQDAEERLTAAAAAAEGTAVTWSVVEGKPAPEILLKAKEVKAGLIVCGAGVIEGREWLMVGTTPDRVVRHSEVPVLVVGPNPPHRLRRVLVPTDLDRPDEGAVRVAAALARQNKGRLSVLHAYATPSLLHGHLGDVAALRRRMREKVTQDFKEFLAGIRMPAGMSPPHMLLKATSDELDAARAIVSEAARLKMDLIVMALGGVSFLHLFLIGAVAEKVMRALPCSLLALPTAWARRR